jgi:hypothetical protein
MTTANTVSSQILPQYPQYTYNFTVLRFNYESSSIVINYIPTNTELTSISLAIPILANFDPANLETYVDFWAPHQKWFGQQVMLTHGDALIGANSNITIS